MELQWDTSTHVGAGLLVLVTAAASLVFCGCFLNLRVVRSLSVFRGVRILKACIPAAVPPLAAIGLGMVTIMAVETLLAHFLFMGLSPTHFGSLGASIGSVFLVTSYSAVAVKDLLLGSWRATVFFGSFLLVKILFLSLGRAVMLDEALSAVAEGASNEGRAASFFRTVRKLKMACLASIQVMWPLGLGIVTLIAVEALLAHFLFMGLSPTNFGSLEASVGSVFLVATFSAAAVEDLLLGSSLAVAFFGSSLFVKMAFFSLGTSVMHAEVFSPAEGGRKSVIQITRSLKTACFASMQHLLAIGVGIVMIVAVETLLAHFLFMGLSPTHFGSLGASIGSVFLVTSYSAVAVKDLLLRSWPATAFFGSFLFVKVIFLSLGNAVMLKEVWSILGEAQSRVAGGFVQAMNNLKKACFWGLRPILSLGLGMMMIMAVETPLAHFLFMGLSPTHFGSLEASVVYIFLVATFSAVAAEDLLLKSSLALAFFGSSCFVKMAFFALGNAVILKEVFRGFACEAERAGYQRA